MGWPEHKGWPYILPSGGLESQLLMPASRAYSLWGAPEGSPLRKIELIIVIVTYNKYNKCPDLSSSAIVL